MKRSLHILGTIVGGLLALGPLWGVFGMIRAFLVLGQSGISDPKALSGAVGDVLLGTILGLLAWPIGATLCAYCIVQLLKKPNLPSMLPAAPKPTSNSLS